MRPRSVEIVAACAIFRGARGTCRRLVQREIAPGRGTPRRSGSIDVAVVVPARPSSTRTLRRSDPPRRRCSAELPLAGRQLADVAARLGAVTLAAEADDALAPAPRSAVARASSRTTTDRHPSSSIVPAESVALPPAHRLPLRSPRQAASSAFVVGKEHHGNDDRGDDSQNNRDAHEENQWRCCALTFLGDALRRFISATGWCTCRPASSLISSTRRSVPCRSSGDVLIHKLPVVRLICSVARELHPRRWPGRQRG